MDNVVYHNVNNVVEVYELIFMTSLFYVLLKTNLQN